MTVLHKKLDLFITNVSLPDLACISHMKLFFQNAWITIKKCFLHLEISCLIHTKFCVCFIKWIIRSLTMLKQMFLYFTDWSAFTERHEWFLITAFKTMLRCNKSAHNAVMSGQCGPVSEALSSPIPCCMLWRDHNDAPHPQRCHSHLCTGHWGLLRVNRLREDFMVDAILSLMQTKIVFWYPCIVVKKHQQEVVTRQVINPYVTVA